MKILVTGFDPFGTEEINPSFEVVKKLPSNINGAEIIKLELPTVVLKSTQLVIDAINTHKPDIVLSLGQAANRSLVSFEQVAINLNDFTIKDNENNQPKRESIINGAPDAYFTKLSVFEIVDHLKALNKPAYVSYSAGAFVCNNLFFSLNHFVITNNLDIKIGFIHIPLIYEQVLNKPNTPFMKLENIVDIIYETLNYLSSN